MTDLKPEDLAAKIIDPDAWPAWGSETGDFLARRERARAKAAQIAALYVADRARMEKALRDVLVTIDAQRAAGLRWDPGVVDAARQALGASQ